MRVFSVAAAALLGIALAAGPALAEGEGSPPPGAGEPGTTSYTTVAGGLDNPRGLAVDDNGDIYVAEAGHGGDGSCIPDPDNPSVDACFGTSGAISRIRGGAVTRVVTGLPSLAPQVATQDGNVPPGAQATGPSDVVVTGADSVAFTIGLGAGPAVRAADLVPASPVGHLLGVLATGTVPTTAADVTVLADIAAYEGDNDPVPGPDGPDSNANSVIADGDGYLVVDAGGNDVLRVDSSGSVTLVATLPASSTTCPPSPANPESVPTSIVAGPDGAWYVSELTGFPFCEGGASVYRIDSTGAATVYAAGLTNLTGLAFADDGTLYAVELAQHGLLQGPMGAVVAIPPGGGDSMSDYRIVAEGMMAPYGIAISGDSAYVTMGSILPVSAGGGSVVEVPLVADASAPSSDAVDQSDAATTTWSPLPGSTGDTAASSFGAAGTTVAVVVALVLIGSAVVLRRRPGGGGDHV